ncbi:hypothetical protein BB560_002433 [Smittium megazygosporum]|uniref:Sugar transporter SWEET1 n=1 Tax=Smittium megazygosporum TaxID=133381 RepID=A0A2T9ZEU1_9FUNG|nr:hypothetical protein BB560_002433 [Smittium megazygosporum]
MFSEFLDVFLPTITTISTVIIFSSQLTILKKLKDNSNKDVIDPREAVPIIPYIATLANCGLWFKYGLITHNTILLIVNGYGILTGSLIVFMLYTSMTRRKKATRIIILLMLTFAVCYIFINENSGEDIKTLFKLSCCLATIGFFSAPLLELPRIIEYQDASILSKPTAISALFSSFLWTSYGILISDKFIIAPNLVGFLSSFIQFCLILYYPSTSLDYSSLSTVGSQSPLA